MPSIPMALRASLASSSLCGWMMASIFFMKTTLAANRRKCTQMFLAPSDSRSYAFIRGHYLGLEVVALLAMHAQIQAVDFLLPFRAYAGDDVANLEDHPGADDRETPCDPDPHQLVPNLARVPVHPAHRLARPDIVDRARGHHAGQDRSQGSASAVHAKRVERIVIPELAFHSGRHQEAEDARQRADHQGGKRLTEFRSRRDGDKPPHPARNSAQHAALAFVD